MTQAITLEEVVAAQAQAKLITYEAKFIDSMNRPVTDKQDYLREYIYTPPGIDTNKVQRVRFPIPMSAAELVAFKGRRRYRRNSTRFVEMTHVPYNDGEHVYYKEIAAFDWVGFNVGPTRLANIAKTWASKNGTILLNTAESASCWDGSTFVSASKSSNPFRKGAPTYKSYYASTDLTVPNVQAMRAEMGARVDFNGNNLGIEGDTLFASAALFPVAEAICLDERLAGGATNPIFKWKLKPKKLPDLAAKRWGMCHASAFEDFPFIGALEGNPDLLVLDRSSAKFETTSHMGYNLVIDLGVKLLRSEAISLAVTP
jgi:hypothetical protein